MENIVSLPPQQLPFNRKTKAWRKKHLDWASNKTFLNDSAVRNSVRHKKINYDLLDGKLHMSDLERVINPEGIQGDFISNTILHYPIMNSKLNVLKGEESKRVFDYRVIITNPNSISEIENDKKEELFARLQQEISNTAQSEEEFNKKLEEINKYYNYEWQDFREIRANAVINHYTKEYNFPLLFNSGFSDALAVGEEIYHCDIIGGEPVIERLNPLNTRIYMSGYSNRIEDADVVVLEDYWSPGRIIDTYYDSLTKKDVEYIEKSSYGTKAPTDSMDNIDPRFGLAEIDAPNIDSECIEFDPTLLFPEKFENSLLPYDLNGNIRVIRMYWKSRRKIKKVKSYDPMTGEETYNFYPETYIINENLGEEEEIYYINEAWEGTKIGENIYVNMRPMVVQYNRLTNPSRCHFGIIGSIYNLNEGKPYSLVDMMKPYNYMYDVIHDRLNKLLAKNKGKIVKLDLAMVPKGWDISKWMYFAETNGIAVIDSFREGNYGASTGKLAGALNNASNGVIDADWGNNIQQYINLLEFIKMEMSEVAGISKQREGQISNRETVGGVERATLQSSHITEWLFLIHDDVKKRVLECFIETAKAAFRGRSKKVPFILPDHTLKLIDINGDEFAESDYGLVVDNSQGIQELSQKLDMLAQAALQNQTLNFSTIMKLYSSCSIAEKQRMVERNEQELQEQNAKAQQEQLQAQQQQAEMALQQKQAEIDQKEEANIRDNETKLLIAQIQAMQAKDAEGDGIAVEEYSQEAKDKLMESMRQFDEKLKLEREKLAFEKDKAKTDARLKEKQINKKPNTSK